MVQNLPQSAALRLTVAPDAHRVQPGEQAVFVVTLENSSNEAQLQSLSVNGAPDAWVKVEFDSQRRAFPGEQRTATVFVNVPAGSPFSSQTIEVIARAGEAESKIACQLEVLGSAPATPVPPSPPPAPPPPVQAQVAAAPTPPPPPPPTASAPPAPVVVLRPGLVISHADTLSVERLTLSVRNPAATPVDYVVGLSGLESGWFTLPPRLRVPAGQTLETEMRLHPPQRARVADYPFDVKVTVDGHTDVSTEANGWLSIQPAPAASSPPPAPPSAPPVQTPRPAPPMTPPPVAAQPVSVPPPMAAPPPMAPPPPPPPPTEVIPPPDVTLAPRTTFKFGVGEVSAQAIITMRNRAKLVERYVISVEGIPAEWYALSIAEVRLEPNTNTQIPLRIAPQTGSGWPAGDYEFRLRVVPQSIPENTVEIPGLISITGVTTFDARMTPVQAEGASRVFDVTVVNTGDLPLTPVITASDPEGKCVFRIPKTRTLDPAQEALFHIKVGAKRSAILGAPETFDFRIKVAPVENAPDSVSRLLDARFIHRAKFGFRVAFMLAFFAVLVAVVTVVVSFAKPTILDAADWVGCQLDSKYRIAADGGPEITKEACGGRPYDTELQDWLNRNQQSTSLVARPVDSLFVLSPRSDVTGIAGRGV